MSVRVYNFREYINFSREGSSGAWRGRNRALFASLVDGNLTWSSEKAIFPRSSGGFRAFRSLFYFCSSPRLFWEVFFLANNGLELLDFRSFTETRQELNQKLFRSWNQEFGGGKLVEKSGFLGGRWREFGWFKVGLTLEMRLRCAKGKWRWKYVLKNIN